MGDAAAPGELSGSSVASARSPVAGAPATGAGAGADASAVCGAISGLGWTCADAISFFAPRPVRRDQKPGDLLSPQKETATIVTSRKTRAMTP